MEEKDITAIFCGIKNVEKRLDRDVAEMCMLVKVLADQIFVNRPNLPKKDVDSLRNHFHDIYKNLKLHLVFHSGSGSPRLLAHEKLEELGRLIGLNAEELERRPDENSALEYSADPWSKLLEIVSTNFRMVFNIFLTCILEGGVICIGVTPLYQQHIREVQHAKLLTHTDRQTDTTLQ